MSDYTAGRGEAHGFSATGAAFEGFVIAKREPKTVLAWTGLMMAFTLAGVGVMLAILGPSMGLLTPTPGAAPDPARVFGFLAKVLPLYAVILVLSVVLYGVIYAAVNRTVLRPGSGGFGHLRLGADELRQMGLLLAIWLGLLIAYVVLIALLAVAATALGAASKPLGVLVALIGGVGIFCAVLFLLVRLSLLSPLAFDRRRIDVGAAWRLTRGRFWPLLGAYALAAVVCGVLFMVASTLAATIGMAMAGGAIASGGDPSQALRAMGTVQIVNVVLTSATYGIAFALMLGAPARAYADLTRPTRAAEVFGPAPTAGAVASA